MSLHRVKFSRHSKAPDGTLLFTSNAHGDVGGEYIQAADAEDVIESLASALWDCAHFIENDMPPNGGPEVRKAREALHNYRRAKA